MTDTDTISFTFEEIVADEEHNCFNDDNPAHFIGWHENCHVKLCNTCAAAAKLYLVFARVSGILMHCKICETDDHSPDEFHVDPL